MTTRRRSNLNLRNPWLVAVWPGMGSVATIAGTYLVEALKPVPVGTIPAREFFSVDHVDVHGGIARTGQLPQSMFFIRRDPGRKRDLIIFVGEAQPEQGGYTLCHRIIDFAVAQGVKRVVTFAAMASQLHPSAPPKVFGAVTVPPLLHELRAGGVIMLQEGQVGGLNGALLAAAAEREVEAMCLLGQLPFYAAGIPNPKSSLAVLEAFSRLTGIQLDLAALREAAEQSEEQLLGLLEQLKTQAAGLQQEGLEALETLDEENEPEPEPEKPSIDIVTRRRIEHLFGAARQDRSRAPELKQELDRLGLFEEYEDRFLDLFRRAG